MDTRFSLSLKQIILLILITVVIVVFLTVVVFLAGQRNALGLFAQASTPTQTATPTMPPLPKAMTATPASERLSETYILTEEQINTMVAQGAAGGSPVIIRDVQIASSGLQVYGEINYNDYAGALVVSGAPYVQNRRLNFRLDSVTVDGVALPQILYPTVEEQINLFFSELLSGYDVESVVTQDGQIVAVVTPW
jgi:hypothetical protein